MGWAKTGSGLYLQIFHLKWAGLYYHIFSLEMGKKSKAARGARRWAAF
jgi:hypothetical protein